MEYVAPPSDVYGAQLELLKTLEEQISTLGISTLAKQNLTNTNAESKRLDRIDSDSIMAIISENLQQSLTALLRMAGEYSGKKPPEVTIPRTTRTACWTATKSRPSCSSTCKA